MFIEDCLVILRKAGKAHARPNVFAQHSIGHESRGQLLTILREEQPGRP
ncbi:hypothetical protein [Acrocarpospora macrocephala]|nr:hypothetical protein [Acrocarpospora macrocephala]